MKITVTTTRVKRKDTIQEIFTWTPNSRFIYDDSRQLTTKLKLHIAHMSLHNKIKDIKLIDINYFNNSIVFIYNIIDIQIHNVPEIREITYDPTLANKTCKNCRNLKKWNNKLICLLRTYPTKKLIGCFDWSEQEKHNIPKHLINPDRRKITRAKE